MYISHAPSRFGPRERGAIKDRTLGFILCGIPVAVGDLESGVCARRSRVDGLPSAGPEGFLKSGT